MTDPALGNRASELGQAESGAQLESINESTLPTEAPILEVAAHDAGLGLEITPALPLPPRHAPLAIRHSEQDILAAQLLEEPEMHEFSVPGAGVVHGSPSRISRAIARNQNREQLLWFGIQADTLSAALGDRIIVRRDLLESEYSCRTCHGRGYHEDALCVRCRGEQKIDGVDCTACQVLGYDRDSRWSCGHDPCTPCHGSGWRSGVIIPEIAQARPVTGVVVSMGPDCVMVKLGDRVLHSKYAGHTLDVSDTASFTFMHEKEIISLLRGL